jgi:hypothetical protein
VFHSVAYAARLARVSFVLDDYLLFGKTTESVDEFGLELVQTPYIYSSSLLFFGIPLLRRYTTPYDKFPIATKA